MAIILPGDKEFQKRPSIERKALKINLNDGVYGTFAEIGAGQEVARHFFRAGGASGTISETLELLKAMDPSEYSQDLHVFVAELTLVQEEVCAQDSVENAGGIPAADAGDDVGLRANTLESMGADVEN